MNPETSQNRRGAIVVVSGPSGVGKSTICRRLCALLPAEFSVSFTTRPQRPGEEDGRDYRFVSAEAFDRMLRADGLLESAMVYGHQYGTPVAPVKAALTENRVIVLEIDINGCVQVRRRFPKTLTFFILPPTPEEQRRRIIDRQTDPEQEIARRLTKADGEVRFAQETGCYDRFLINDDLDATVREIHDLILKEIR